MGPHGGGSAARAGPERGALPCCPLPGRHSRPSSPPPPAPHLSPQGTSRLGIRALHSSTDPIVTELFDFCLILLKIAAIEPYFARSTN